MLAIVAPALVGSAALFASVGLGPGFGGGKNCGLNQVRSEIRLAELDDAVSCCGGPEEYGNV
jgi:hypothetical protein